MSVIITSADIGPLKAQLLARAPLVQSSHRVEGMARGFGFGRYASLQFAVEQGDVECEIDDAAFLAFVQNRGGSGLPLTILSDAYVEAKLAGARAAIDAILAREPDLSANGYRTWERRFTAQENRAAFESSRSNMLALSYVEQFAQATAYLQTRERSKRVSRDRTSYGYKHDAERYLKTADPDANSYVANGMFIAAALHLGFTVKRDGSGPNAFINIAPPKRSRQRSLLAGTLNGPKRAKAWRNVMVAAINAGLDQGVFGLAEEDNNWSGDNGIFRFEFDGLPAIAAVRDAGFGELAVNVAVNPTHQAEQFITSSNAGYIVGDAFTSGWLERRDGAWLQTSSGPIGSVRNKLLDRLVAARPVPNGYRDSGRLM